MIKIDGLLHQPKNTMPRIEHIWAFLSVDKEDGNEGVCAVNTNIGMMPLIVADEVRLEQVRPIAKDLANRTGMVIRLAKFSVREDLETVK